MASTVFPKAAIPDDLFPFLSRLIKGLPPLL
jgi:hypothetical protein